MCNTNHKSALVSLNQSFVKYQPFNDLSETSLIKIFCDFLWHDQCQRLQPTTHASSRRHKI